MVNSSLHWPHAGGAVRYRYRACNSYLNLAKIYLAKMKTVTIHEAKTNLSRLIEKACRGEEVIIARGPAHQNFKTI